MKADRRKVKSAMERAHMTVHDLAKAAGLPPQTTAAIICGMNVQPDTMVRIAQALDVGMADILYGAVPTPKARAERAEDVPQRVEPPELPAGQVRVNTEKFVEIQTHFGLSAKQLADRAGVSPDTVRSIKRGAEAHKESTVEKLANALGVAVYHIIKGGDGI